MRISGRNFDVTKTLFGNRQTYILFQFKYTLCWTFQYLFNLLCKLKTSVNVEFSKRYLHHVKAVEKLFISNIFLNKTMLNFQTDTFTFMLKLLKNFSFLTSTTWDPNLILLSPSSAYLSRSKNIFSINIYYLKYS